MKQTLTYTQRHHLFSEGRDIWYEYIRVNGYAFKPTDKGLSQLARILDLHVWYIRERINAFLSA